MERQRSDRDDSRQDRSLLEQEECLNLQAEIGNDEEIENDVKEDWEKEQTQKKTQRQKTQKMQKMQTKGRRREREKAGEEGD